MNYLIDTNIISEVRKGRRCDPNVASWYEKIEDASLYLSVLVIGEIHKGIGLICPKPADLEAIVHAQQNSLKIGLGREDIVSPNTRTTGKARVSLEAR